MKIKLYKDSKIYVLAPANVATGGVELLHQLAYKINNVLGFDNVFIKYIGGEGKIISVPKDYEKYDVKCVFDIDDLEKNVLIVPEVFTKELNNYKNIRKIVWWLSVDNYYFSGGVNLFMRLYNNRILLRGFNSQNYIGFNKQLKNIKHHRVQSEYAKQHLIQKGINPECIEYLSDYLIVNFFDEKRKAEDKKNIICYNPKKGFKFTKPLIDYMEKKKDDVEFIPIQNMTRSEVIGLLKKAKCYIDFGFFPGKDRIPREAAVLGNVILISKMGAGKYFEDFPLNKKYKIDDLNNLELIRGRLVDIVNNYEKLVKDFCNYNSIIKKEEDQFNNDLLNVFIIH